MAEFYKVLSIDGGGIRGIIPAVVLAKIEELTGKQIWELFDMITGTSTGGLLALGLTKPHPEGEGVEFTAKDIVKLYEDQGARIFKPKWPGPLFDEKYPTKAIAGVLDEYFGDARLGDALTEVLITAYEIERRRPVVFKRRHARSKGPKRREHDVPMKQVAHATAAAPTYFEPVKITIGSTPEYLALVDGGVYANNPALCGYVEALKLKEPEQKILLITLGTGELTHPLPYDDAKDWGLLAWARRIIDVVFDGVSDNVEYLIEHLAAEDDQVHRFQIRLDESTAAMDNAEAGNIRALKLLGEELVFQNRDRLQKVANLLT